MCPGQKILTRVRSGQSFMVWVWIWKISPKNVIFFNFYPSGKKKSLWVRSKSTQVEGVSAAYLLRVKSNLESGQGPSLHTCKSKPKTINQFLLQTPRITLQRHYEFFTNEFFPKLVETRFSQKHFSQTHLGKHLGLC